MRRLAVLIFILAAACSSVWQTNWKSAYDSAFEGARALSALDSAYVHELDEAVEGLSDGEAKRKAIEAVDDRFKPVYDSYEVMRKAVGDWLMLVGTDADAALVDLAAHKARYAWCEMRQEAESIGLRVADFAPEPCK